MSPLSQKVQFILDDLIVSRAVVRQIIVMVEASGRDREKERRQKQGMAPKEIHNDLLPSAKALLSVVWTMACNSHTFQVQLSDY